ncbi:MAG: diguanylate cyclase, partial [Pseudomonadales bacterium]|nr:diguanylate cyclase [Pseudomonadales bacterium]
MPAQLLAIAGAHPHYIEFKSEIDSFPQNFDITQTSDGRIYIASYDGVLVFDGENWQLVDLPGEEIVRSVVADGQKVYVGSFDDFGFLERSEDGTMAFRSLLGEFSEELRGQSFYDIWDILITPQGVFFKALNHVFLWNPETGEHRLWRYEGKFGAISRLGDKTILQFRGEGIRWLSGKDWVPLNGTGMITELVMGMAPLPEGGLLTISRDGKWYRVTEQGGEVYGVGEAMPPASMFTDIVSLGDETLALTTDAGYLYLYDPRNGDVSKSRLENGFLNGVIAGQNDTVFVVGDTGFFALKWPSEWLQLDEENGLQGSVVGGYRADGETFVMSSNGVYRKKDREDEFHQTNWTDTEAWDLIKTDEETFLLADSHELKLIEGETVTRLGDDAIYPRILKQSQFHPDRIYVGTDSGIGILEKVDGAWKLTYYDQSFDSWQVNSIEELDEDTILAGAERASVQKVSFSYDEKWRHQSVVLGQADGIDYGAGPESSLLKLQDGRMIVSTRAGFFEYEHGSFRETDMDGLQALKPKKQTISLDQSPDGTLWAFSYNHLYKKPPGKNWSQLKVDQIRSSGLNYISFDEESTGLFAINSALVVHASKGAPPVSPVNNTLQFQAIELEDEAGEKRLLSLTPGKPVVIEQGGRLSFSYAVIDFFQPDAIRYQYSLSTLEGASDRWLESNRVWFYGLEPGEYEFSVRARLGDGSVTEPLKYQFSVSRYWYQHPLMQIVWVILISIALTVVIYLTGQYRSRRLREANAALEEMVRERTRELEAANLRLEEMAHVDGLTEIPNRRKLDTVLEESILQCEERSRTMGVVLLDVDFFKKYNDSKGHL